MSRLPARPVEAESSQIARHDRLGRRHDPGGKLAGRWVIAVLDTLLVLDASRIGPFGPRGRLRLRLVDWLIQVGCQRRIRGSVEKIGGWR